MTQTHQSLAIIGGGITGLAAALEAQSQFPQSKIVLLESSDRLGGVLKTDQIGGYLIERSADMFSIEPPFALELCQRLGRVDALIQTNPIRDRAYVVSETGIHPVPRGLSLMAPNNPDAIMSSPLLDESAKQRFAAEATIPPRLSDSDESLQSFAVRRFGRAMFDRLIQPLAGGIYTADPAKLSMQATMARFIKMEREYGSLTQAATQSLSSDGQASGARYSLFRTPKRGMGEIVTWILAALDRTEIRFSSRVELIEKNNSKWMLHFRCGDEEQTENFDAVVLATSAQVSAKLVGDFAPVLTTKLNRITAASTAIVIIGVDDKQLKTAFDGYGIIVPHVLGRQTIATSFSSNKFPGRTPDGKTLIRCFIGGALQHELVDLPDEALVSIATQEIDQMLGLDGTPELTQVFRWRDCMPQYHLGHLDLVSEIESLVSEHAGLELAGNSYRGVGVSVCIQSGIDAVKRLANV